MRIATGLVLPSIVAFCVIGCTSPSVPGSPGVPEPIKVLENPTTGERERFFREVPFKVPADYRESDAIAKWTEEKANLGFTKEVSPADDRERLAELRRKNLEAAQKQ